MTDDRLGVVEEHFGMDDALNRIEHRGRSRREVSRQTVDLLAVENRVALQERNLAIHFLAVGAGLARLRKEKDYA